MADATQRKPLDGIAFAVMVPFTALWGVQQVVIKLTAADISYVMQAGIRSIVAIVLLLLWVLFHRINLWDKDRTLWPGIVAGLLFGGEFVFIYAGLEHTSASRMIVFIYLAPVFTALGLHWKVPGEKLVPGQWLGVLLSFCGIFICHNAPCTVPRSRAHDITADCGRNTDALRPGSGAQAVA